MYVAKTKTDRIPTIKDIEGCISVNGFDFCQSPWVSPSPLRSGHRRRDRSLGQGFAPIISKHVAGSEETQNSIQQFQGISHLAFPESNADSCDQDHLQGCRHAVESCIRSRQFRLAESCINNMLKIGSNCSASCIMLSEAYLQVKDFEKSLHWLDAARKMDAQINLQPYNSLLDACAKSGALEFAECVIEHMSNVGVEPDAVSFNSVIDACSKARQVSKAVQWVERMRCQGVRPDVVSFSAVLNAYAQCGLFDQANEWLRKMEEGQEGVHPNVFSYNTCINAQVRSGLNVVPEEWTNRMRHYGVLPNVVTYTTLCQPAATRGDFPTVEKLMTHIAEENLPVNHYCLAVLLNAYANSQPRQCDRAESAFIDAVKRGLPINGTALRSLQRCLTRGRFVTLCSCHGVDYERLMNDSQRTHSCRERERSH